MPWTPAEATSHTFTRPFGTNEAFIKLVSDPGHPFGREHRAVNYTAVISPSGTFKALSRSSDLQPKLICYAWSHLRFQHPSLTAHPDASSSNVVYTVPASSDALQAWISQTFTVVIDSDCVDVLIPTIAPTPYAQLYYILQASQLLLHTAHWRMDGVGGLLLLG